MKRLRFTCGLIVLLGWASLLGACGASTPAPSASATPSPAPVAATAAASTAVARTAVATAAPAPSATSTPLSDIRQFIDQVTAGPHDTVKSADGSAELLIPQGALPSGKSASDLSIKPISAAQADVTLDGQPPRVAYQLEPDGLQFSVPVLLSITQSASSGGNVPALFTLSGDQASPLTPIAADFDVPSGKLVAMAAIRHFSTIVVGVLGAATVHLPSLPSQVVMIPFLADAVSSLEKGVKLSGGTWRLGGRFSGGFSLVPQNAVNPRFPTMVTSPQYKASQQFTCVEKGIGTISYDATFQFDELITISYRNATAETILRTEEKVDDAIEIVCREPTPTAVATVGKPPTMQPLRVGVNMGAGRDGQGPVYAAVLSQQGDQTQVELQSKVGAGDALPAFIQQGACPNPGTPRFPLNTVASGLVSTVVDAGLASLLTGEYSINVQKSASQPNVYVACGNIPKGTLIPLGAGRDGDQTPGTIALLAAGVQTDYIVAMLPADYSTRQPVNIYQGSCAKLGSVKYPLGMVRNGNAYGTISAPPAELLKGGYALSVQRSAAEPGLSVACADLK